LLKKKEEEKKKKKYIFFFFFSKTMLPACLPACLLHFEIVVRRRAL